MLDFSMAEIFGVLALTTAIIGYQMAKPNIALYFLCFTSILWGIHFVLLGDIAFIVLFLNAFRSFCAAKFPVKYLKYVIIFCMTVSCSFIITQAAIVKDILPIAPVLLTSFGALNRGNERIFRLSYLAAESIWIFYGLLIASYSFVLGVFFVVVSIIISIIRHDMPIIRFKGSGIIGLK